MTSFVIKLEKKAALYLNNPFNLTYFLKVYSMEPNLSKQTPESQNAFIQKRPFSIIVFGLNENNFEIHTVKLSLLRRQNICSTISAKDIYLLSSLSGRYARCHHVKARGRRHGNQ